MVMTFSSNESHIEKNVPYNGIMMRKTMENLKLQKNVPQLLLMMDVTILCSQKSNHSGVVDAVKTIKKEEESLMRNGIFTMFNKKQFTQVI
jgi:hypothetical protein